MAPRMPEPPGGRSTVVAPSPPEQIAGRVAGAVRWWSVWRCRVSSRTDGERDEEQTSGDLRGRGSGRAGGGISRGGSGGGGLRVVKNNTSTEHASFHCAHLLSLRTLGFHCARWAFTAHTGIQLPRWASNGNTQTFNATTGIQRPRSATHQPRWASNQASMGKASATTGNGNT